MKEMKKHKIKHREESKEWDKKMESERRWMKGEQVKKDCIQAKWLISGFSSTKRLEVFLLHPGWDAFLLHGYPPALNLPSTLLRE